MQDLTGSNLGPYQIVGELGHGGMANVYRAIQPSIGREVAIKVLPAHFLQDRGFLERFNREVKVIALLQHPRILPVHDYGEHEGMPYIVMAYIAGGTLADRIRNSPGGMPPDEVARLVGQIAEGLDYAHEKGVIHRDFKPSNVLLDEKGNAHLADFGIAKITADTAQITGSGMIGTPAYMAPEMSQPKGITPLIDVYALGVTVFQMLTGAQPFPADTPIGVIMAHATQPVPRLADYALNLPDGVQDVIDKALAKDPAKRTQSAGALAADLRDALAGLSPSARGRPIAIAVDPNTMRIGGKAHDLTTQDAAPHEQAMESRAGRTSQPETGKARRPAGIILLIVCGVALAAGAAALVLILGPRVIAPAGGVPPSGVTPSAAAVTEAAQTSLPPSSAPPAAGGPTLGGCPMFPADNYWNVRVDNLPVDPNSDNFINAIGATTGLHPDFGSGNYDGGPIGIPFNVVTGIPAKVSPHFEYADESDPGPYPIPDHPNIEWGSDHHILIVDSDNCMLYEIYAGERQADGSWTAGSGAIWNLKSNALRPNEWTSADAAGLPILPGLARYDEVAQGHIDHALRFTAEAIRHSFIWPARHRSKCGDYSESDPHVAPMGQRFRLKASFDISAFSKPTQVILTALKQYGMILADCGSNWFIGGAPDPGWNNDTLVSELRGVPGSAFEAVNFSGLMVDADSGATK